ncbi:TYRO protein tyrosine kinase-binding protein [Thunnus albacares]|uniref:TYRO protein tyrosine kinase-binding protein n=1 Tax=Thunnus albacares TaxID=8236 RepID=UPI001CF6F99F|nr:TYRO protein tyrosine kinase-binding protein [Thunnus albacares]
MWHYRKEKKNTSFLLSQWTPFSSSSSSIQSHVDNPHTPVSIACGQLFLFESSYCWLLTSCLWVQQYSHLKDNKKDLSFPPLRETSTKNMSDAICIVGSLFGSAEGQQECGSCYLINMGSVMGIIACDIILTIFITISVFCFVNLHKRRREWDSHNDKRNLPSSSKKMTTEVTESPYQELHGVQSDVYSELRHFRK